MEKSYVVIEATAAKQVAEQVNFYMRQGYTPVGGISVAVAPGGWSTYVQAMVRGE